MAENKTPWMTADAEKKAAAKARAVELKAQKDEFLKQRETAISNQKAAQAAGYDQYKKNIESGGGRANSFEEWNAVGVSGGGQTFGRDAAEQAQSLWSQAHEVDLKADAENLAAQGLNPDGSPIAPEFQTLIDPATGKLMSQYQLGIDQLTSGQLDPTKMADYQAFRAEATRTGPSAWAKLMQEQQGIAKSQGMDEAARQAAASQAGAQSQLAMRGGLSSGARERIAMRGGEDLLGRRQEIGRQANVSNLQLLTDDERQRMQMFGQLPGMEQGIQTYNIGQKTESDRFNIASKAKADEYNIQQALMQKAAFDEQNMTKYQEQLKKYGSEKQAEAVAASGSGGGGGGK